MSNKSKYIDCFNYTDSSFLAEFTVFRSCGGLEPFGERCESLEEASEWTGVDVDVLEESIDWESNTITNKGKLFAMEDIPFGQWRFEVTPA